MYIHYLYLKGHVVYLATLLILQLILNRNVNNICACINLLINMCGSMESEDSDEEGCLFLVKNIDGESGEDSDEEKMLVPGEEYAY